jgi:acyl-coenzyme A thioesterase PaaI-like protein
MDNGNASNPGSDLWKLSMDELRARFYDFPTIPLHMHLGITFARERGNPDGPAVCTLPATPEFQLPDGTQSEAAIFTIGEVSGGVAVSDAVVPVAARLGMRPVILTKSATFRPLGRARGSMTGTCNVHGDYEDAVTRMTKRKKADVAIAVKIVDEHGTHVGESVLYYYVRLMDEERLKSMAAMSSGMGGWS